MLIPKTNGLLQHFRSYPSAGALYPLELYVVYFENDVASLFHFEPTENRVAVLAHDIARADFVKHSVFQDDIHNANAFFVITANMMRTMTKYGERGYRFVMIETGHLAQNILLTSEALGLRTCPIGRFLDDELKQFLKIDASEDLLYVIAIN